MQQIELIKYTQSSQSSLVWLMAQAGQLNLKGDWLNPAPTLEDGYHRLKLIVEEFKNNSTYKYATSVKVERTDNCVWIECYGTKKYEGKQVVGFRKINHCSFNDRMSLETTHF